MTRTDPLGGVPPRDPSAARRARLQTLPPAAPGANCATCRWSTPGPDGLRFCHEPGLRQAVAGHQVCARWDREDAHKSWQEV